MANQGQMSGNFPLDNLTYDLITIIQNKSQGLEAYDKYMKDAQSNERVRQSLEKIRRQDEECIRELTQHLGYVLNQQSQQGQQNQQGQQGQQSQQGSQSATGGSSARR